MGWLLRDTWQLSLRWAGEIVAVEQRESLEGHPWLTLPQGRAGWREADVGEVSVLIERVEGARWPRWSGPSRLDRAASLAALALVTSLHALTFLSPSLSPVQEERSPVRYAVTAPQTIFPQAVIHEDPAPLLVARALSPCPEKNEALFPQKPSPERPLSQLGTGPQERDRGPAEAEPSRSQERGLLDVASELRPEGPLTRPFRWYTVRPGDTLDGIARRAGLSGYLDLYTDEFNPELRRKRPDPDRVFPGDKVRLPA